MWLIPIDQSELVAEPYVKVKGGQCNKFDNTDYDGYAVTWGNANKQPNWEACCKSCQV